MSTPTPTQPDYYFESLNSAIDSLRTAAPHAPEVSRRIHLEHIRLVLTEFREEYETDKKPSAEPR